MAYAMAIVMSVALRGAFMRPMARLTKMGRRIGGRLIQRSIKDIGRHRTSGTSSELDWEPGSSRGSGLALGFTRLALDHGNA